MAKSVKHGMSTAASTGKTKLISSSTPKFVTAGGKVGKIGPGRVLPSKKR